MMDSMGLPYDSFDCFLFAIICDHQDLHVTPDTGYVTRNR